MVSFKLHDTYTSPFAPIAGTAPSAVLSASMQSPVNWLMICGLLHETPWLVDFEKRMRLRSVPVELPYMSNSVHVTYIVPLYALVGTPSYAAHALSWSLGKSRPV